MVDKSKNQSNNAHDTSIEPAELENRQRVGIHEKKDEFSSSIEEYIEMIYRLSLGSDAIDGWVKNLAISERLNVAAPSTTKMLKKMQEKGLIEWKPRIAVKLTDKGVDLAKKIIKNHLIVELFFRYILNLPDSEHLNDLICKLEHDLCSCVVDAMENLMGANKVEEKIDGLINKDEIPKKELIQPIFSYMDLKQIIKILRQLQLLNSEISDDQLQVIIEKLGKQK
jgi:DtxR family Mn-dependent transcriptional regulator